MPKSDGIDKTLLIPRESMGDPGDSRKITSNKDKDADDFSFDLPEPDLPHGDSFFTTLLDVDEKLNRNDEQFAKHTELELDTEELMKRVLPDVGAFYEVLDKPISGGGQATISEGRDRALRRIIAIKTLRREHRDKPEIRREFLAEAQLTSQLEHPAIVPIYSVNGDGENGVHIGMKLIKGKTLKLRLAQISTLYQLDGILRYDESKSVFLRLERFLSICDAIAYAHSKGIMHCDLKPENIMIGEYNETYVMDWGIARPITHSENPDEHVTNHIAGTPRYLSPEAILGRSLDERSDIYSLGLILFEMVTLSDAVPGDTPVDVMRNIRDDNLNPLRHQFGWTIPPDLAAIIRKATKNNRRERYKSVTELADDIRRFMNHSEVSANPDGPFGKCIRWTWRHSRPVAAGVMILLLLLTGLVAYSFYGRMKAEEGKNVVQSVKGIAFGNATLSAFTLEGTVLRLEQSLQGIASAAELALSTEFRSRRELADYVEDGKTGNFVPGKMIFSNAYREEIGLSGCSFKLPRGGKISAERDRMERLNAATDFFRKAMLKSRPESGLKFEKSAAADQFIRKNGVPVKKILVGFSDGLMVSYPATRDYDIEYDPRKRSWYKNCDKKDGKQRFHWEGPYFAANRRDVVMTCSLPLLNEKGERYGVVAIDVLADFLSGKLRERRVGGIVEEKMLLNSAGDIVMHSNQKSRTSAADGESVRLIRRTPFPDRELLGKILLDAGRGGILLKKEESGVKGYIFCKLSTLQFIYLEKVDFGKLKALFESNIVFVPGRRMKI